MLRELAVIGVTDIDTLELNRAGKLSPKQRSMLNRKAWIEGWGLVVWLVLTVIALHVFRSENWKTSQMTTMCAGFLIVGQFFIIPAAIHQREKYLLEVSQGAVQSVEGQVTWYKQEDAESVTCWCHIDEHKFQIPVESYYLLKDHIRYRLYYTPDSEILVNLEPVNWE